jgi:hypothetical protein
LAKRTAQAVQPPDDKDIAGVEKGEGFIEPRPLG